ncbi:MAG: WD40 repeat domain-containing protein, partial [Planctomycetes bacterium]|nr:WD40 repeat domain-containing protein [Planctomycetota bacterium]
MVVLRGHTFGVRKAVFNSDATQVLTAGYDKTARVWDVHTGRQLLKLEGHQELVTRAVFSHDNQTIATGSADATVRVWDAQTGELRFPPLQHEGGVSSLVFSPDNNYLLSSGGRYPGNPSNDHLARIWNARNGESVQSLKGAQSAVYMAVYSGDGNWIATSSQDGQARIYEASTGNLHLELDAEAPVYYLACDAAGKYVAATTSRNDVRVWRIADGSLVSVFRGQEGLIRSLDFSRNGARLLTASDDGTAREWLVSSHGAVPVIDRHGQTEVKLSPDGLRLVTWAYGTPTAELRRFPSTDTVAEITPGGDITSAVFSSDAARLGVATSGHQLAIYDAADGHLLQNIKVPYDSFHFGFDTEAIHVIVIDRNGAATLQFRIDNGVQTLSIPTGEYNLHTLSPTGDRLFAYSRARSEGQLWNLNTGETVTKITGDGGMNPNFDPSGRKLLVWSNQRPIAPRLYDAETGEKVGEVPGLRQPATKTYFISNGEQFIIETDNNHLHFFDSRTTARLQRIQLTGSTFGFQRVNHDFTRLLSQSSDKTLRLWDLSSGKQLAVLIENAYGSGTFSPDGKQLVTWDGNSNLVVLRRAQDGATLMQFTGPSPITTATFDPSGEWIVATCRNGEIHVWPTDPLELGRRSRPRTLSPSERERLDVGDRRQWPKYRQDWTAERMLDDLAALTPALAGGGTWQQRNAATRLFRK